MKDTVVYLCFHCLPLVLVLVLVYYGSFSFAVPANNQRGHSSPTLAHRHQRTAFEQKSNVPNSDFIGRHLWSHMSVQTHTNTPFMESHTRIFWLFLAGLLPSQYLFCHPAGHTALQLGFYIPVRQNYSRVHNVSQMRRFQFLVWTQTLEDMGFRERVWAALIKWYEDLIDQQVLQVLPWIENAVSVTECFFVWFFFSFIKPCFRAGNCQKIWNIYIG